MLALKPGFRHIASSMQRPADIFVAGPDQAASDRDFFLKHDSVRHQQVFLANRASRELFRERTIGQSRFGEHHHAGSLFIEPVNYGEPRPARFLVPQPIK